MKKNIILTAFSLLLLYGCTGDMERIQTGTNTEELIYADAAKTRQILNNLYARTRLTQGSFSSFSGDGVTSLTVQQTTHMHLLNIHQHIRMVSQPCLPLILQ